MRSMRKKIFMIHGGGKIGLGLMADILSRNKHDYEVISTSNNTFLNALINNTPYFYLQHGPLANNNFSKVKSVTMVPRDSQTITEQYKNADIIAICLTPEVLNEVAKDIAKGLILRAQTNPRKLKILVVMNKTQSDQFVFAAIREQMVNLQVDSIDTILSNVEFIPAVVDRIVTEIKVDAIKDQLRKQLETINPKTTHPFIEEGKLFSEQIEDILENPERLAAAIVAFQLQYNIFNAEENFNLFVPDACLANQFPAMKFVKSIELFEEIKIKYINGPHAILAWIGALLGCNTIAEAIHYPGMEKFINDLMEKEICPILMNAYPDITKENLDVLKNSFINRCKQSIDDPVLRVGRNPSQKLNTGERVQGTLSLGRSQLAISTSRLEYGMAAGILYAVNRNVPTNPNCEKIIDIYKNNNGSYRMILGYLGINSDKFLVQNIISKIQQFKIFCEKQTIYHHKTSSQLILSKAMLKAPFNATPRYLMSPHEKSFLQMLVSQHYSGVPLQQDPVRLNLPKKSRAIYVSNDFANTSLMLFGSTKESMNETLPLTYRTAQLRK